MSHAQGLGLLTLPACTVKFKPLKMGNVGLRGYANPTLRSSTSPLTSLGVCPDFSSGSILDLRSMISKMELTALLTFVRSVDLLVDREIARALMVIAKNTCQIKTVSWSVNHHCISSRKSQNTSLVLLEPWNNLEHLQRCSVCDPIKILLTSKFSCLHFSNPMHKAGTANRWETTNSNPPGLIKLFSQQHQVLWFAMPFTSLSTLC